MPIRQTIVLLAVALLGSTLLMQATASSGDDDDARIRRLETRINSLERKIGTETAETEATVLNRVQRVESELQQLERTLRLNRGGDMSMINLRQLPGDVSKLQNQVSDLSQRLASIEREQRTSGDVRSLQSEVNRLSRSLHSLERRVSRLESRQ